MFMHFFLNVELYLLFTGLPGYESLGIVSCLLQAYGYCSGNVHGRHLYIIEN